MDVQVQGDGLVIATDRLWNGITLREALERHLMLPGTFVKTLFAQERVIVGRGPAAADDVVTGGSGKVRLVGDVRGEPLEGLHGYIDHSKDALTPLWEDSHAVIFNKPAGLIIYPSDRGETDTLAHRVAAYYISTGQQHKIRHVHRLDKDTTGAILYAKHGYIARALDALLAERRIERTYLALVQGQPKPNTGSIRLPIGRDRHTAGRYRVSQTGKDAVTVYKVLDTVHIANGLVSFVQCKLETGRTHQIRVHMAAIGCPIVGDILYGGGEGVGSLDLEDGYALHAAELSFYHPYERQSVTVTAPLPEYFARAVDMLGFQRNLANEDSTS